jgi:hypothetical protein
MLIPWSGFHVPNMNKLLTFNITQKPPTMNMGVVAITHKKVEEPKKQWTIHDKSRGLGDTIAKVTHATHLDKLAKLYTKITGKDCGCWQRQIKANERVPYESGQTQ